MLHGQLFLPGDRICKHQDCCNPLHLVDVLEEV
jgi:hypothetical protein